MISHARRVLVLSPHTDDAEYGCGGTLARLIESGAHVFVLALSECRASVPKGFPPRVLVAEFEASMNALGVSGRSVHVYPVRHFPEHRQQILETLVQIRAHARPDLVFCPASCDYHQDHAVVADEAFRAFKETTILGYVLPWNAREARHDCYVHLDPRHLDTKVKALACYRSQQGRGYMDEGAVRSLARVHGLQCGAVYAEAFEAVRFHVTL